MAKKKKSQVILNEMVIPVPTDQEPVYSFDVWFNTYTNKKHWKEPMRQFATKKGVKFATIEKWNELFQSY